MKRVDSEKKVPSILTIGVIGGLGPQATMDFEVRVHEISQELVPQYVNRGYPPLLIGYFRHAPMVLAKDGSYPDALVPDPRLLELAITIGSASDFLVITSNTPHLFIKQIEDVSNRKVLSMVDVTIDEVKRRKLRRVGVLAVGVTLDHRLYQDRLERAGFAWEAITKDLSEKLDESIWALMEGLNNREADEIAMEAVDSLRLKEVDGIILGCTELPLLLKDKSAAPDLINPVQLLAEAAVRKALEGAA